MKKTFSLLIFLFFCGCEREGTDIGNPGVNNGSPDSGIIAANEVTELVDTICERLSDCEGSTISDCSTDVMAQTNIDTELGLADNDYEDLAAIANAVNIAEINVDSTVAATCESDFSTLSCSDPLVVAAYDSGATNPYEGVAAALPNSCDNMFDP